MLRAEMAEPRKAHSVQVKEAELRAVQKSGARAARKK